MDKNEVIYLYEFTNKLMRLYCRVTLFLNKEKKSVSL